MTCVLVSVRACRRAIVRVRACVSLRDLDAPRVSHITTEDGYAKAGGNGRVAQRIRTRASIGGRHAALVKGCADIPAADQHGQ